MFILKRLGCPHRVGSSLDDDPQRALRNMKTSNGDNVVWFLEREIGTENFAIISKYLFVYQPLPGTNFYFLSAVPLETMEAMRVYPKGKSGPQSDPEKTVRWYKDNMFGKGEPFDEDETIRLVNDRAESIFYYLEGANVSPGVESGLRKVIGSMVVNQDLSGLNMLCALFDVQTVQLAGFRVYMATIMDSLLKEYRKDSAAPGSPMEKSGPLYSKEIIYGDKRVVEHYFHPSAGDPMPEKGWPVDPKLGDIYEKTASKMFEGVTVTEVDGGIVLGDETPKKPKQQSIYENMDVKALGYNALCYFMDCVDRKLGLGAGPHVFTCEAVREWDEVHKKSYSFHNQLLKAGMIPYLVNAENGEAWHVVADQPKTGDPIDNEASAYGAP